MKKKAPARKLPDCPEWTDRQLDSLDKYLTEVVNQASNAIAVMEIHADIVPGSSARKNLNYWRETYRGLRWFRGQLRNIRRFRRAARAREKAGRSSNK